MDVGSQPPLRPPPTIRVAQEESMVTAMVLHTDSHNINSNNNHTTNTRSGPASDSSARALCAAFAVVHVMEKERSISG
jgi:hypothetical protein